MNIPSLDAVRSLNKGRRLASNLVIVTGILVLTVWLYAPTRHFEFVNWDDPWYIVNNPLVQSWSFANLKTIATESVVRNYAPLTIFSFLIEYTVWDDWAGGYHLVNVLLHAINAVLVYFLLRQLTARAPIAVITAVLFAVHPVHVESVAWVSSRKGLLSGVFLLASFICWLREDRKPQHEAWGIFWLILSLLSKAIAVVVPAIVLCYDVFVRRDKLKDAFVRQIIPGFLCLWLLLTTMAAQGTMLGGVRGHFELNRLEILAVDLLILWRYVGMLLWPENLCVLYNPPTSGILVPALIAGLGWAALGWWIWSKRDRHPLVLFAALSWVVLLLPVLNLFPITTLMNDRYLYLPSIPALAVFVGAADRLLRQLAQRTTARLSWSVGGVLVLIVGFRLIQCTQSYLLVWRNDRALWSYASQQTPELVVVQYQWALSLYNSGQKEAALRTLDYALTHCQPDDIDRKRIQAKKALWAADN